MTHYEHCQVVTTIASRESAEALSRGAVAARLAACAQVTGPVNSTYWWQEKVETAQEWSVLFKTTADRYAELERHIRQHHDYDVPEILCTPVTAGSSAYLAWVTAETREQ